MTAPADLRPRFNLRRFLLSGDGWPYLLAPFIPLAILLELLHAGATPIFFAAALGVIPTAALMGRSTEELSARSGPSIGGFLNVTFGNFPELVIALFALAEGLQEVVKASIVGSILGNILLVMGAAMLAGGLGRDRQHFDRTAANVQSLMLLLAAVALVMPAIFELVAGAGLPRPTDRAIDFPSDLEALSIGGGGGAAGHLRRRAGVLPPDPPRPVQPLPRRGGARWRAVVAAAGGDHAGHRRGGRRGDIGDPGRLHHRGVREPRPLAVLRRHHRGRRG